MLSRNSLLYILAGLIIVIVALHGTALAYALYWYWWWYDLVLHFLGGVFSTLVAVWFCFFSGYTAFKVPSPARLLRFAILSAILIGLGWELFERFLGHSWSPEGYYLDTGIDLVMDTLGGLTGFLVFFRKPAALPENEGRLVDAAS